MGRRSAASRKQKQKKLAARKDRLLNASKDGTTPGLATPRATVADVVQEVIEQAFEACTAEECSAGLPTEYPEDEFRRFGGPSGRPDISIAPMMAWTDHHFRQLVRLIERQAAMDMESLSSCTADQEATSRRTCPRSGAVLLVTEMLEADRIAEYERTDADGLRDWLSFDSMQQPLAAQIGGGDPAVMALAARHCAAAGYAEVNLNIGCPSNPVCGKGFGVSLMKQPSHVASIVAAVRAAVPNDCLVTVKHRLGVDNFDSFGELLRFVRRVAAPPASCQYFIVHARKAILGLSTAANRTVPPLRHDWVLRLVRLFPALRFELNGHVQSVAEARALLDQRFTAKSNACLDPSAVSGDSRPAASHPLRLHGVMIGRAAYHDPWMMYSNASRALSGWQCEDLKKHEHAADAAAASAVALPAESGCHMHSRLQVAKAYCAYAQGVLKRALKSPAAAKPAFLAGVYRPNTNTTTYASSSMRKEVEPVPYFARGCKAVHSCSELRYRLAQPLLNLFQTSSSPAPPATEEATATAAAAAAAAVRPGLGATCGLCELRRFNALLLKAIKARKFESFDPHELDSVAAEWSKGREHEATAAASSVSTTTAP